MKRYLVLVVALLTLGLAPMAVSAATTTTIVKPSEQRVVMKDYQVQKVRHGHRHGNYYYYSPYGYDYYYYNPYGYNYYYTPNAGIYFGW